MSRMPILTVIAVCLTAGTAYAQTQLQPQTLQGPNFRVQSEPPAPTGPVAPATPPGNTGDQPPPAAQQDTPPPANSTQPPPAPKQ